MAGRTEAQARMQAEAAAGIVVAPWRPGASVVIDVAGISPVSKGNLQAYQPKDEQGKAVGRPRLFDTSRKGLKHWERTLREAGAASLAAAGLHRAKDTPFSVEMVFYEPRKATDYAKGTGNILPSARCEPWVKPDLDKLLRAILDGLTGVVWDDDSRVVTMTVAKRYAGSEHDIGVWIRCRARPATIRDSVQAKLGLTPRRTP